MNELPSKLSPDYVSGRRSLAKLLGVSRQTIHAWEHAGIVPPPDATIGSTAVWWRSTVREIAEAKGIDIDGDDE